MPRFTDQQVLLDSVAAHSAVFTAENVANLFTSVAHGLSNGDRVKVSNSAGALPNGLTADTWYYVIGATDDDFQLSLTSGGSAVNISDDGSGTQTFYQESQGVIDVQSFDFALLSVDSSNSAAGTIHFRGSILNTAPDFSLVQTAANQWDNLALVDMENISTNLPAMVQGDTGLALTGTDDHRLFRIDVRGLKWLCATIQSFTAGNIRVVAKLNAEFHD